MQNIQESNLECIHLFSERFSVKEYVSKIFKKIIENVFICFVLQKVLYQKIHIQNYHEDYREHNHLFSEKLSIKQDICKIFKNII